LDNRDPQGFLDRAGQVLGKKCSATRQCDAAKRGVPHTIVLATQKGGSGKSTLAIGALAAIQAGHNVRLIETDSQARHPSASSWVPERSDGLEG
jgi:Mrp family chromosome partitioning ATPase